MSSVMCDCEPKVLIQYEGKSYCGRCAVKAMVTNKTAPITLYDSVIAYIGHVVPFGCDHDAIRKILGNHTATDLPKAIEMRLALSHATYLSGAVIYGEDFDKIFGINRAEINGQYVRVGNNFVRLINLYDVLVYEPRNSNHVRAGGCLQLNYIETCQKICERLPKVSPMLRDAFIAQMELISSTYAKPEPTVFFD